MTFREELIQVAAVAVAIIEDIDYGEANAERLAGDGPDWDMTNQAERIGDEVYAERLRQDEKWGPQTHDPNDWLHILMEEVGEAAEEIDGADPSRLRHVIRNAGRASKRYLTQKFGM